MLLFIFFAAGCTKQGPLGRIIQNNMAEMDKIQTEEAHEVTKIVAGDTIEVESGERVRLLCIEAPQKGERYYDEAKAFLEDRILDRQVTLVKDVSDRDKYLSLLRYVYIGDDFINADLVENGYAKVNLQEPDTSRCGGLKKLESEAKEKKLGIWS